MIKWIVSKEESGQKLLDVIRAKTSLSAKKIKASLDGGACFVNDRVERFSTFVVGAGDSIIYDPPEKKKQVSITKDRVLYDDPFLFIYDKPPGIAVDNPNFLKAVEEVGLARLILLHRLDKDTSGVLLFAKSKEIQEAMIEQFQQRKVKKTYLAIVDGLIAKNKGRIENRLDKVSVFQGQSIWGSSKKGKEAITEWVVVEANRGVTLVECKPITGRTHQLRVHLSEMGHPILGDFLYGRKFTCNFKPNRYMLHASKLEFEHPKTRQNFVVEAEVPEDMKKIILELYYEDFSN